MAERPVTRQESVFTNNIARGASGTAYGGICKRRAVLLLFSPGLFANKAIEQREHLFQPYTYSCNSLGLFYFFDLFLL